MILRIIKSTIFQFVLIFIAVAGGFYFYTQPFNFPYFFREDSFYHVAITKYMMQHGLIVHKFPFLQYSILKDNFIDWHFGYHLLLIPFIKIFGEISGPKILGLLLVGGIFGFIYLIFNAKKFKFAFLYTIILFFLMTAPFFQRMSYIRGPVLSLFLMVLAVYLFVKNRPIALAVTMFIYVWAYYLASYLIFIPIFGLIIIQILRKEQIDYRILLWAVIGYLAGFIINPYFPENIGSLIVQLQAASQNDRWYAGQEWASPVAWRWFYATLMATMLFLSGIVISIVKNIRQDSKTIAILIFTICILILQWKSQRFSEYWPVWGGVTGIILIGPYVENVLFKIKSNWKKAETWMILILIAVFIQESIFHGIWQYNNLKKDIQNELKNPMLNNLKEAIVYLKDHSEQGEVVFTRWDYFSYLFYFNQKNYYIGGLDPIFTEKYNKQLFEEYIPLTLSRSDLDPNVIKSDFHAQWVLVDATQTDLKEKIQKEPEVFQKVYENAGYTVFKIL